MQETPPFPRTQATCGTAIGARGTRTFRMRGSIRTSHRFQERIRRLATGHAISDLTAATGASNTHSRVFVSAVRAGAAAGSGKTSSVFAARPSAAPVLPLVARKPATPCRIANPASTRASPMGACRGAVDRVCNRRCVRRTSQRARCLRPRLGRERLRRRDRSRPATMHDEHGLPVAPLRKWLLLQWALRRRRLPVRKRSRMRRLLAMLRA